MKNVFKAFGTQIHRICAITLAAIIGFSFTALSLTGCGGGDDGPGIFIPQTVTYQSADTAGYTYILIITVNGFTAAAGDSYVLTIKKTGQSDKISKGAVSAVGADGTLTLQPKNSGSESFDITISGGKMTAITGTIAIEGDGEPVSSPGTLTPQENGDDVIIDGWSWGVYGDSEYGGTSTITMTQGTGNDNKKLTFTGNVNFITGHSYGWAGWGAGPDAENLAALKNASSISFKCKGNADICRVDVRTSNITDGGSHYRTTFEVSETERTIIISYNDLYQPVWSEPVEFDKNLITHLIFEFFAGERGEGPFNMTMWDLKVGSSTSGGGSGGTFTLTNIPSEYNGKYAVLSSENLGDDRCLYGAQSMTPQFTFCQISNRSVSLPMWKETETYDVIRYYGNDTVGVGILITASASMPASGEPTSLRQVYFSGVAFANGSATRSWNDGYQYQ